MKHPAIIYVLLALYLSIAPKAIGIEQVNQVNSSETPKILSYKETLILGIIQGITEFLPVSSTGHLIITNHALELDTQEDNIKEALDAYAIIIQGGTILAILLLYWKTILGIIHGILGRNTWGKKLARNLILAFLPAASLGIILGNWIENHLFNIESIIIALITGSGIIWIIEKIRKKNTHLNNKTNTLDLNDLSIHQSLTIGALQCLAMWPGTSRSMMTIVGGYIVGLSPTKAAEFSFLLGFITLSSASAYKIFSQGTTILKILNLGPAIFGCTIAFITGALVIRWLINYLNGHGLMLFAWYRVILALGIFLIT